MMSTDTILQHMIDSDTRDCKDYVITHHKEDNPYRIDLKSDEVVYIESVLIKEMAQGAWLEFHSATESRTIQEESYNQLTRHKGAINFTQKDISLFSVSYIRLKLIK
jgi:hypothetical protein